MVYDWDWGSRGKVKPLAVGSGEIAWLNSYFSFVEIYAKSEMKGK